MNSYPVLIIPSEVETWRINGAEHAFLIYGGVISRGGNIQVLGLQGAGIIEGKFIKTVDDAQALVTKLHTLEKVIDALSKARGGIAVQIYDASSKQVFFLNDPLGAAPIYIYKEKNVLGVSSDLASLVTIIKSRGGKLCGNPYYFAAGHLTATEGYGASTPYFEIELLPRGLGLKITGDGEVSEIDVGGRDSIFELPKSYEDEVDSLCYEFRENVTLAASGNFDGKFAHLTGGFDSRLVLAAIKSAGLEKEFIFSCIPGSRDWDIASRLAGEIGLRFSGFEGNKRGVGYAQNYYESLTRRSRNSSGAIVSGVEPSYIPANTLLFQGGYGEVMRTFNAFNWSGPYDDVSGLAFSLWRWASFPRAEDIEKSMWSKTFLDHCIERLGAHAKRAEELEIPVDAFTNYLYVEGRNRYWVGLQSFYGNRYRTQFDPLYSTRCVSTPLMLPFSQRKANFLGLDVMRKLASEISEYPFDREIISAEYEASRGAINRRSFTGKLPEILEVPLSVSNAKTWPGAVDAITSGDKELAKSLGISALLVAGVRKYGGASIALVQANPLLKNIYNVDSLNKVWDKGNLNDKSSFITLNNVISTLFHSGLMEPTLIG